MRIVTITLNPAIDQYIFLKEFKPNEVNRAQAMVVRAGGKGVNVACALADAGLAVAATGFLGQVNDAVHAHHLARKGIEDLFVRIPGETRTNIKLMDSSAGQTTDINLPGLTPSPLEIEQLDILLDELASSCRWFVLTGGMPPGMPPETYARIIARLNQKGCRVALDSSGDALRWGTAAGPALIKPNLLELSQLAGEPLIHEQDVLSAALACFQHSDMQCAIVSMGAQGALFMSQRQILRAIPPAVKARSTVGAGDALLAGWLVGELRGLKVEEQARLAVAFSIARITSVDADLPPVETIMALSADIRVTEIRGNL